MNKKTIVIIAVIVGVLLFGGLAFAYNSNQNDKKEAEQSAMMKKDTEIKAMEKQKEADAMKKEEDAKMKKTEGDAMMHKTDATTPTPVQ
jgi:flagellar basal body-associated protein FliL